MMFPEQVKFSPQRIEFDRFWREIHMTADSIRWALSGFNYYHVWDGIEIQSPEEYRGHWSVLIDFHSDKVILTKTALSA